MRLLIYHCKALWPHRVMRRALGAAEGSGPGALCWELRLPGEARLARPSPKQARWAYVCLLRQPDSPRWLIAHAACQHNACKPWKDAVDQAQWQRVGPTLQCPANPPEADKE